MRRAFSIGPARAVGLVACSESIVKPNPARSDAEVVNGPGDPGQLSSIVSCRAPRAEEGLDPERLAGAT